MPESFGARLRRQREQRGIALEALAKQTRIKESLLEALERDDLSPWPSGFYRRAFFRAYTSAIGLDPDATFREFQQLYPEPPEGDVVAAMAAALGVDAGRGRTGIRSAVESAFSSLARLRPSAPGDSQLKAVSTQSVEEPASPPPTQAVTSTPAAASTTSASDSAPPEASGDGQRDLGVEACGGEGAPDASASARPETSGELRPDPAVAPSGREGGRDLTALAELCVELGCVTSEEDTKSLLQHAARLIGAAGLIVWAVNPRELQLEPALVHGYSPRLVAQLPMVRRSDNNATAEAFRTVQTRVFHDTASGKSALAIPLRTASGCVGVFAAELERGIEATKARVAVATLLAAQLAPIADSLSRPMTFSLPYAVNGEVQTV